MLEKDIENLVSQYPDEFLPQKNLKLVGQQVKLETYFADILFEDKRKEKTIIEVKRGILTRDAIPQIMDYYGILKIKNPESKINLIIVANVIPKERVVFLSERIGIKFVEIPISRLIAVAKKHSYSFLDEEKSKTTEEYRHKTQILNRVESTQGSNVWIFQSNPKRFDILNALDELDEDVWGSRRYKEKIKAGDIGIIWMSGKDGGIYAIADIITNPDFLRESEKVAKFWFSEDDRNEVKLRVRLKYRVKLKNNPIFREEVKNIPQLKELSILKQSQGTNFPVTENEWDYISNLVKERI